MAGSDRARSNQVAATLRAEAAAETAKLNARRQQALSGKPVSLAPVTVTVNKHSLDLTCGKKFVKISTLAYGKLCTLHRRHAPPNEATAEPPPAPPKVSEWVTTEPTEAEASAAAEAAAARRRCARWTVTAAASAARCTCGC